MGQASFVLKEPQTNVKEAKDKVPSLVYLLFTFNGSRLKYSTGIKIHPKYWNTAKQRAKDVSDFPLSKKCNLLLNKLEADVHDTFMMLLLEKITPTPEHLRARLNESLKKENGVSKDLALFAEQWLRLQTGSRARKERYGKPLEC